MGSGILPFTMYLSQAREEKQMPNQIHSTEYGVVLLLPTGELTREKSRKIFDAFTSQRKSNRDLEGTLFLVWYYYVKVKPQQVTIGIGGVGVDRQPRKRPPSFKGKIAGAVPHWCWCWCRGAGSTSQLVSEGHGELPLATVRSRSSPEGSLSRTVGSFPIFFFFLGTRRRLEPSGSRPMNAAGI